MASKYDPLHQHLTAVAPGIFEITLTFTQIEAILGQPLPRAAHDHPAWWGTDHTTHTQARAWLGAGWKASPDLAHARVTFRREA